MVENLRENVNSPGGVLRRLLSMDTEFCEILDSPFITTEGFNCDSLQYASGINTASTWDSTNDMPTVHMVRALVKTR